MSIWGVHSIENDSAVEWSQAYREMGLAVAKSTIDIAMNDHVNNGLTVELSHRALAAVEAVAFEIGAGTDESKELFSGAPDATAAGAAELVEDCNNILTAISGASALRMHWAEVSTLDCENWEAALADLRMRVNSASSSVANPAVTPAAAAAAQSGAQTAAQAHPAAAPVAAAGDSGQMAEQMAEMRAAIAQLSKEVKSMRKETADNFVRLAKWIERNKQ
jgi:hypothetical protein